MTEKTPDNSSPSAEPRRCYRCGADISADVDVCPSCGRSQSRLCYCGKSIPVDAPACPYCGADWSGSRRVSRAHRRRSGKVRPADLVKSGAVGAGVAVGIVAVGYILMRHLAVIATGGAKLPPDAFSQLDLAWQGFRIILGGWGEWLFTHRRSLLVIGGVLAIGGAIGISTYLANKGLIKLGSASRRSSHKHGGRRRRSTSE